MSGTLYIVATPIGNLEDISARALRILTEVDTILAEDTRVTKKILSHFKITTSIQSYHHHTSDEKRLSILKMLMDGKDLALTTDAGTPGISDPGNELIQFILERSDGISVVPIPGPSSLTTAISASGLNLQKFTFLGYFPKKKVSKLIELIKSTKLPVVFFDSPYRIIKTIDILIDNFPESREVVIAQELTKVHERIFRGTLTEAKKELLAEKEKLSRIKGEIVVILNS